MQEQVWDFWSFSWLEDVVQLGGHLSGQVAGAGWHGSGLGKYLYVVQWQQHTGGVLWCARQVQGWEQPAWALWWEYWALGMLHDGAVCGAGCLAWQQHTGCVLCSAGQVHG